MPTIDEMKTHRILDQLIASGGRVVNENAKSQLYVLFIVGDDKTIMDVAVKLNTIGFFAFHHNGYDPKTGINRLECRHRIKGYPVREFVKRWGFKTRAKGPMPNDEKKTNIRNSDEDSSNAKGEPIALRAGDSHDVESEGIVQQGSDNAYSTRQDVQSESAEPSE